MTDIIIGMGEVGSTLYALFTSKKIKVDGQDEDPEKCRISHGIVKPDVVHMCIPFHDEFIKTVENIDGCYQPKYIIIHSTVSPRTCEQIKTKAKVIYSPTRGVHTRFLEDIMRYTKFYAYDGDDDPNIRDIFSDRFDNFARAKNILTLELAKILTDTTYYGLLIGYRKIVDNYVRKYDVNPDEVWEFAVQIHEFLGNRPIMYNDGKPIGGHCVIPNLDLLDGLGSVKDIIQARDK